MIIIVNPNAPTGTEINFKDIETVLEQTNKLVLLDEAYADFAQQSSMELLEKYDNLIVIRTFSKSQALAGLRLGIALSSKEIITELNKVRSTYNINRLTQSVIKVVFENWKLFKAPTEKLIKEREKSYNSFTKRGYRVQKSKANFLSVEVTDIYKVSAKELYEKLKERKILVRYFGGNLKNVLRVSIGLPEEMNALFIAIDKINK